MEYIEPHSDDRFLEFCVYCGGAPETRDHVPSKVLLDDPLPANLPVVGACLACNQSFSKDEEYLSCLLEAVLKGTAEASPEMRHKVRRILTERPAIAARIKNQAVHSEIHPLWEPEVERVNNVVFKLAQGHAAYELSLPLLDMPKSLGISPLMLMTEQEHADFEQIQLSGMWPEVGSRAMIRIATSWPDTPAEWNVVQSGRYRFTVSVANGVTVKMVLSEYLACEVRWD